MLLDAANRLSGELGCAGFALEAHASLWEGQKLAQAVVLIKILPDGTRQPGLLVPCCAVLCIYLGPLLWRNWRPIRRHFSRSKKTLHVRPTVAPERLPRLPRAQLATWGVSKATSSALLWDSGTILGAWEVQDERLEASRLSGRPLGPAQCPGRASSLAQGLVVLTKGHRAPSKHWAAHGWLHGVPTLVAYSERGV